MQRTHTFDYDGVVYTFHSGTMRDREIRKAIMRRVMRACGWDTSTIPDEDNTGIYTYATALTYLEPVNVPWWRAAGDTPEALADGYHLFGQLDDELYDLLDAAETAVQMEKKMMPSGSKK